MTLEMPFRPLDGWSVRRTFTYGFPGPETSILCSFSHHRGSHLNFTQTRGGLARFRTLRFVFFCAGGVEGPKKMEVSQKAN